MLDRAEPVTNQSARSPRYNLYINQTQQKATITFHQAYSQLTSDPQHITAP